MIPSREQITKLWDTYDFPRLKRIHVTWVARTAVFLAERLANKRVPADTALLEAAALLHDIDKNVPKLPGESHPDAGVRVLKQAGLDEIAALVRTHPLHSILDPTIRPRSWEEKLLYLSDKMVKYEVITVDKRFALWRAEDLPDDARRILDASYPKVKRLEEEVLTLAGLKPAEVAQEVTRRYTTR